MEIRGPGAPPVILDAGTGIRACGASVAEDGRGDQVEILLSHTHWDHVQGLPFFRPLHESSARVRIRGPRPHGSVLADVVRRLFAPDVFPLAPAAQIAVEEIAGEGQAEGEVAGWSVRATPLCHPGRTLGYRLERPGCRTVAYVTDNELAGDQHGCGPEWRPKLVDFLAGVDLLVHDATNAPDQAAARRGWGHSTVAEAVALGVEAGCGHLVLFHHDPDRTDGEIDRLLDRARREAAGLAPRMQVDAAVEGAALPLQREE